MNIAYIRPYFGETEIVTTALPGCNLMSVQHITDLSEADRQKIVVLSVFVDVTVDQGVLDQLPNVQLIATRSAGYDHIDMEAAHARNIMVTRVPHYGTRTVAEYAIALMFALSRNVYRAYSDMQANVSVTQLESYEGFDLSGKTLGVVGTGAIGKNVCEIAKGIGMNVLAYDVNPDQAFAAQHSVQYVEFNTLLAQSDIVTLHVPSLAQTYHLLNEETLGLMKKGSYLINTARGDIVDTKALVAALMRTQLAGAGLDVLEGERELREEAALLSAERNDVSVWQMLVADHALIDMPNVIVTPHIAFNTIEAKREITDITIKNIQAFIAGDPQNIVMV